MKNPLRKRIFKEIISEKGRYITIFLFMTIFVGFISGFLVADDSMLKTYNDSFEKYNVENGNFEIYEEASDDILQIAKNNDLTLYENFYIEETVNTEDESTLRIFKIRTEVDKACLFKGSYPENSGEIAIDRVYANNNDLKVGDSITVGGKSLKITGFVALSDYSTLYSDNSDTMFDSIKFGVAVMTEDGFNSYSDSVLHYDYAWKYSTEPKDEIQEKEWSDKFSAELSSVTTLTKFIPGYCNQAIHFAADDFGGDEGMMQMILYIVTAILAFIFAVTISNTISKEATVIGTLRASGYSRGELVRHYMAAPVIVTLISALLGNIMGYTFFKNFVASIYYNSYSLPNYVTVWNVAAFIKTTLIPVAIMIAINFFILRHKLKLEPLKFIRRDLSKKNRKKAVKLPHFKFINRFKLRVIFQNIPGYITIFIGVVFANFLLLFGMMMHPLLKEYEKNVINEMICNYQYVLKTPVATETDGAEHYLAASLITDDKYEEEVTVYGIVKDSKYVENNFEDGGIYISKAYNEKYGVEVGDKLTLKVMYSDKTISSTVKGIYNYNASISVFMTEDTFRDLAGIPDGYYNGYFSNEEIKDIDENYIETVITKDDLTKTSRQLNVSMGTIFYAFNVFAVILFILIIFLLSKLIIEKNANSISMVKILGYNTGEIRKLYLSSTTIMVAVCLLLSLPIVTLIMNVIYKYFMMTYAGWLTLYIDPNIYWEMFLIGMVSYFATELLLVRKIKRIPMEEALKIVE